MKELAKICNVSVSTVSKAFHGAEDISEETKNLIFETAKSEGVFGKFYKGKYHKKIIAVICPEITSEYYSSFLNILQTLIEKEKGICVISSYDFSPKKQKELVEYYSSYLKVDGIIVFSLHDKLKKGYDVPIVSIFSSVDSNVDSVKTNTKEAIGEATGTLASMGHKKIAFIGERLTSAKANWFRSAAEEYNLDEYHIVESSERFEEAGIEGVKKLIEDKAEFSAIICGYDKIAFGAIKELKRNNLRIPEDVSVIGIDNISSSKFFETELTSIDTKPEDICHIAFDLLLKKMDNKYFRSKQDIIIKSSLIIRESISEKN